MCRTTTLKTTSSHVSHYNHISQQSALPREQARDSSFAAMLSTLSTDDCMGIVLVPVIITILLAPHRCLSWFYTLLAYYHGSIALLARTEVFIFCLFLFIIVEDVCQKIYHATKPLVLATLGMSNESVAQTAPISATYATISPSVSVNNQLRTWMKEDAEELWKSMADAREQEAQISQELRDSYRELASEMPDREIPDWDLFEMEERGRIGL